MADCFSPEEAAKLGLEGMSEDEVLKALQDWTVDLNIAKRQSKIQAIVFGRAKNKMMGYKDGGDVKNGLQSLIARDRNEASRIVDGEGLGADLDSKIGSIRARYQSRAYDMIEELSSRWFGLSKRGDHGYNVMRALWGDNVDPKFKRMAADWEALTTDIRIRFNKAGGDIPELKDWRLTMKDSPDLMRSKGKEAWVSDIKKNGDLKRMGIDEADADKVLGEMYDKRMAESITGELDDSYRNTSKVANRHQDRRRIHYKDSDAWIAHHKEFSDSTVYDSMMDYISMMSNEIGLMENFGPNAKLTFESLAHIVDSTAGKGSSRVARNTFAELSGELNPDNSTLSKVGEMIRNWTSFAKLPGAVLSAPPDVLSNMMTARYNGFSGMKTFTSAMKLLATANTKKSRKLAADLGMQLDFMIDAAHAAGRYFEVGGHGASATAAGFTIKFGGLNHWTMAQKMSFHFNFMEELGKSDIRLNEDLMSSFERYGIGDDIVSEIVNSTKMERGGISFLDPQKLSPEAAEAVTAMIHAETKVAVPEADARVRAALHQGTKRGDVGGEAIRFITMFKTFTGSVMLGNWARIHKGTSYSGAGRIGAAASLFVGTTILGAMSLQMKEIAKGKDPHNMEHTTFWSDAILQGGGTALVGDVFSSDARDFGTLADYLGGPGVSALNDIFWRGALGTIDDAKKGNLESERMWRRLGNPVIKMVPNFPVINLTTKMIWERSLHDMMRQFADPRYDIKQMKRSIKQDLEYDREVWE